MAESFHFDDEFLEVKSELRFLTYAIEQSLLEMGNTTPPADIDAISYGFSLCARRTLKRLDALETEALRRL